MHRKKILVVTLVAFMVLALTALAQKGKNRNKGGGQTTFTVTFRDLGGVVPVAEPDRILSDCRQGDMDPTTCPYIQTSAVNGKTGNFLLKLEGKKNRPPSRQLFLDFTDCATPGECNPPFSQGLTWHARVYTSNVNLNEMGIGVTKGTLRLRVTFDPERVGGLSFFGPWSLWFDPVRIVTGGGDNPNLCPDSTLASVTRTDPDTWEIFAGKGQVACLMQPDEDGTFDPTDVDKSRRGRYSMPFKITVQKN